MTSTQQKKILNYCKQYGSITIRDAFTKLNINSPGKRISEMRNSPFYKVESIVEHHTNEQGERKRYMRYFIHELQTNQSN